MSSARSIRYVRHSLQKNMVSQASFAKTFRQQLADYLRLSTGFNELQSSAVGNSRLSTMDYCTVKLAPTAAKLTVFFFIQSQTRREFVYNHNTRREQWFGHYFSKSLPYEMIQNVPQGTQILYSCSQST